MSQHMPNVWGAGQLFAFSGVDGFTDYTRPLVLHTGATPGSFTVKLPAAVDITVADAPGLEFSLVLGDCLEAGAYRTAFLDCHTLAGELPPGASVQADGIPVSAQPRRLVAGMGLELWMAAQGSRWTLVATDEGASPQQGIERALAADLNQAIAQRSAFVRGLQMPAGLDAGRERLLRKATSVIKVNVEAPCGRIRRRWTTPDRWPHRHMWLWDSGFHAIGLAKVAPELAPDALLAMLEQVQPDGMLPHMIPADAPPSKITQPPVLAWAALRVLEATGDRQWAGECLPLLERYLDWMRLNRDRNGNGVPEWFIEGEVLCRCGESGLDNSPRFDRAVLLDATDFASLLANDWNALATLAAYCGQKDVASRAGQHVADLAAATNAVLWCEEVGLYLDRDFEGHFSDVKAVTTFFPLLAGIPDPRQAEALRRHLADATTFAAPLPVPSTSLDSGRYCKDMWRGPTWINCNYVVICGLRRYGFTEEADRLKEQTLAAVQRWYESEGCLYEYYDSLGVTAPHALDRKQRLISGKGMAPISDYHWTAALTAALLLE
jgi:glycogen debranching enzyme